MRGRCGFLELNKDMNEKTIRRMRVGILSVVGDNGSCTNWLMGEGSDGSRWIEPGMFDFGPDDVQQFALDAPGCLFPEPRTGRLLLNVEAVLARCRTPEALSDVTGVINEFFKQVRSGPPPI